MPSQSNPPDLISRGIEPSTFPPSTLWWKGKHRSTQEILTWSKAEFNIPKLLRFIAYCRRFHNRRYLWPTGK